MSDTRQAKDTLVIIRFDGRKAAFVLGAENPAVGTDMPLCPGQRKDFYTFLVTGVPPARKPQEVAELVMRTFRAKGSKPGREWHVAYNVPWDRLRKSGAAAPEPSVTVAEAAEAIGRTAGWMRDAVILGKVAVTRTSLSEIGRRGPSLINPADYRWTAERYPKSNRGGSRKPPP